MELDLFTPLKDGPMTVERIAQALSVRSDKLKPLLYALVAASLLTVEWDFFSNTPEVNHFLVRGWDAYIGESHRSFRRRWDDILNTAETIRTGVPQGRTDFGSVSAERMEFLARRREPETMAAARDLMARYDFSSHQFLLDVGAGAGYLSIAITRSYPRLRATVVDLPTVEPIAQRVIAEAGCADRVQFISVDVVNEPLNGSFDVAVLRTFVQVLSPTQARLAIKNIGRVTQPGGTIYVLGRIIDDSRITRLETVGFNLVFLNLYYEGQAYTEQEHREWLSEAGFVEDFERLTFSDGSGIIKARKAA